MNQVAIHNGELLFTDQTLNDTKEGNIRLIGSDDPLFGPDGIILTDGNVYLNQKRLYRGISFLLRGKGKRLIISQENIEAEKDNIGRYWLIILFMKILPIEDEGRR